MSMSPRGHIRPEDIPGILEESAKRKVKPDVFGIPLNKHIICKEVRLADPIYIGSALIRESAFADKDVFFKPIDEAKKSELKASMNHIIKQDEVIAKMKYVPEAASLMFEYLESIPDTLFGREGLNYLETFLSANHTPTHQELKEFFTDRNALKPLFMFNLKHLMKFFQEYFNNIKAHRAEILELETHLRDALFQNFLKKLTAEEKLRIIRMFIEECDFIFDPTMLSKMSYHIRQSFGST